jgi:hypothetical protein
VNRVLVLWLSLAVLAGLLCDAATARASGENSIAVSSPTLTAWVDPNKGPSEFNHHLAGWALIGVGLLVLVSIVYPNLGGLRYFWPALFLLMGLFLLGWSDSEIWPRGNMSWTWLLHHDHEAGQHKIYALLLMAIGFVEYLRAHGSLNHFWRAWAFPILAIVGAALLLIHDHTASGGASSPESRAYLINPALDPDGKPPTPHAPDPMPAMDHSMMHMDMDHSSMTMEGSSVDHSPIPANDAAVTISSSGHHHHMTPSMLLVEREHFWFMIVGLGVALFKLVSDGEFWRRRFIPYVWPGGMMLLGILLVLYRE